MRVKLFAEHHTKKNALSLFVMTLLFCFLGSHLRIPAELSLFWPVNAIVAAVIVRHPYLHRIGYYLASFAAMVVNDTVFSGWAWIAVTLNVANLLFIIISVSMLVKHYLRTPTGGRLAMRCSFFRPACWPLSPVPPWAVLGKMSVLMPV